MLTTQQVADAVGLTRRAVRKQCAAGRLPGATKTGRDWLVPARYADPAAYRSAVGKPGRKPTGS